MHSFLIIEIDLVKELRKISGPATSRSAETLYDALSKYGIDFTEMAMLVSIFGGERSERSLVIS